MNKRNLKGLLICTVALAISFYITIKRSDEREQERKEVQKTEFIKGCEEGIVQFAAILSEQEGLPLKVFREPLNQLCVELQKRGYTIQTQEVGY